MFLFAAACGLLMPLGQAIGLTILILIHELGHVWMFRTYKIPHSPPYFVPFMGAAIIIDPEAESNISREVEARIAIGGPLIGTAAAVPIFGVYFLTQDSLWLDITILAVFINLFNVMVCIPPFDGGRILKAVGDKVAYFLAMCVLLFLTYVVGLGYIAVILWVIFFVSYFRFTQLSARHSLRPDLPLRRRIFWACVWLGLLLYQLSMFIMLEIIRRKVA